MPLHLAATFGRLDVVKLLLAAGAAPDAPDKRGRTSSHDSARGRDADPAVVERA